jgi:hypothetical protein
MTTKRVICSLDILNIKLMLDSGRFRAKINEFGSVLLEDTISCEAIQIMQLPEEYSFHAKGKWLPSYVYTSHCIDSPMKGEDGWCCSECGYVAFDRSDWCPDCGADMRDYKNKKLSKELEELLGEL